MRSQIGYAQVPKSELPKTYPAGRRCQSETCITVLCRFNPGPLCYAHTPDGEGILIETATGWRKLPLEALISRSKLAELVPNRG